MNSKPETKTEAKPEGQAPTNAARTRRTKRKWKRPYVAPGKQTGSPEAKKGAAAVLEVLAGERRPSEAASVLGVSIMRYHVLESRALQGLLDACEPRPRGPRVNPEKQVSQLARQVDTLKREVARYQALARASHRTFGIAPVKSTEKTKEGLRRRRRPVVRALKAAAELRRSAPATEATTQPQTAAVGGTAC